MGTLPACRKIAAKVAKNIRRSAVAEGQNSADYDEQCLAPKLSPSPKLLQRGCPRQHLRRMIEILTGFT
jgi:hypothetical protein